MTELEYYDQKAERNLDANDIPTWQLCLAIAVFAVVLLIVGIAWGIWG